MSTKVRIPCETAGQRVRIVVNWESNTLMKAGREPSRKTQEVLNSCQVLSFKLAVEESIRASGQGKPVVLHIDALELVHMGQGGFIYRLLLSRPQHFQADQPLILRVGRAYDSELIQASILRAADQEICIICQRGLPNDVRLLHAEFDPGFIFAALREFVLQKNESPVGLAHQVAQRTIPQARGAAKVGTPSGVNNEQLAALRRMVTGPMHFLWGPPGTGKTWTLGGAVVEWFRRGKSVLIVSTSNVAVDLALKAAIGQTGIEERRQILRLGNTKDLKLSDFTVAGRLARDSQRIGEGLDRIQQLQRNLQEVGERLTRLLGAYRPRTGLADTIAQELEHLALAKATLEAELSQYQATIDNHTEAVLDNSTIVVGHRGQALKQASTNLYPSV